MNVNKDEAEMQIETHVRPLYSSVRCSSSSSLLQMLACCTFAVDMKSALGTLKHIKSLVCCMHARDECKEAFIKLLTVLLYSCIRILM